MKRHGLTPDDLLNAKEFELIEQVPYSDLKSFILKEIGHKSLLIKVYSIAQIIAVLIIVGLMVYYLFGFIYNDKFETELVTIIGSVIFSFTLLIVIHELIHAATFRLLGKKNIGFGAQWEKLLFYAESNREVLNSREMLVVALAPFLVITMAGLAAFFFIPGQSIPLAGLMVFLVHFFFCGGDFAIISFFNRQKPSEIYTFDDRLEKRSYYFRRI